MKLYYYKKNHKFHCFTECNENFNIFTLFEKRYKLLGIKYNFYKDIVLKVANGTAVKKKNIGFTEKKYESDFREYSKKEPEINIAKLNPSLLNIYTFYSTPEWLNDGISEQSMKDYNIKYSIDENKIIIPHYDYDNNLIGIRARALNPEDIEVAKYMPVQIEGKIMSHPLQYNLYGLNLVKDNIKRLKIGILVEAEKSCMQYNTIFGKENNICVASCGSSVHEYQIKLLLKAGAEKILIAYDKEGETWDKQEKYFNKLRNICVKYKNLCLMGFIYDSKNLLDLKDSPLDKGKETFLKLYKGAIWL